MEIDYQRIDAASCDAPPYNCPVCLLAEQKDREIFGDKLPTGVTYHGVNFHVHDFALIRACDGPCHIGYITDIRFPGKLQRHMSPTIVVKMLGRVSSLAGILPQGIAKEEVGSFSFRSHESSHFPTSATCS
jgi:DNA (cytosine-5)-methyltransferase 1